MTSFCYLAGPMSGLNYDEAIGWRNYAIEKLKPNIKGLSPIRDYESLESSTFSDLAPEEVVNPLLTARAIMVRDRNDVFRSDALLVNFLGAKKVSIGTVIELGWANRKHKPIVCIMEPGNIHNHAMIHEVIDFHVSTLDEGISVIKSILAV